MMDYIDLRSDTVTRPTPAMRQAMMDAEVGDDVFREDCTMTAFENRVAAMFGMEAGLFVPSGTMSNQIGLHLLTRPGDEVLIDKTGHVFNYEGAAASHLSSIQLNPLPGKAGKLNVDLLKDTGRGGTDWEPRPTVVALENTTNKGGGVCYSRRELEEIKSFANEHNLKVHLDGARIWNALIETEIEPDWLGTIADTLSVCFSKGLGAPVGSMLLSNGPNIDEARRIRKMLGGGMRQIGMLAAAADYAVTHHWPLLKEDHRRARTVAEAIDRTEALSIDLDTVETNILIFNSNSLSSSNVVEKLKEQGILMAPFGEYMIRATFHLHIDDNDVDKVCDTVKQLF